MCVSKNTDGNLSLIFVKNSCTFVDGWWSILWWNSKINRTVFILNFVPASPKNSVSVCLCFFFKLFYDAKPSKDFRWTVFPERWLEKLLCGNKLLLSFFELKADVTLLSSSDFPAEDAVVVYCSVLSITCPIDVSLFVPLLWMFSRCKRVWFLLPLLAFGSNTIFWLMHWSQSVEAELFHFYKHSSFFLCRSLCRYVKLFNPTWLIATRNFG